MCAIFVVPLHRKLILSTMRKYFCGIVAVLFAATTEITAICETNDFPSLQGETDGKPVKVLKDNQLYIRVGDKLYDATGRLISSCTPTR